MTTTDIPILESTPTPLPPPDVRNLLQVVLGVLIKPRNTFGWLREHGGLNWLIPLALFLVLALTARAVAIPIEQKQLADALAQIQQQVGKPSGTGGGDQTFTVGVSGPGGFSVGTPQDSNPANDFLFSYGLPVAEAFGGWLLTTILIVAFAWILGGRPTTSGMLRLSSWALVPLIVRFVVVIIAMVATQKIPAQGLSRAFTPSAAVVSGDGNVNTDSGADGGPKRVIVSIGPGGVGNFEAPSFGTLFFNTMLNSLDLYTVWQLALLAIGLSALARLSWIKAILVTVLYWVISLAIATLPLLLGPLMGSLLGGGGGPTVIGP
jgi:Yip1 domain